MRKIGAALLFCGRRLSLLVLVVVAAAIALSVPDQTLEVYRRISEKPDLQQLACGALSVLLCAVCAFIAATYALSPSNSGIGPAKQRFADWPTVAIFGLN